MKIWVGGYAEPEEAGVSLLDVAENGEIRVERAYSGFLNPSYVLPGKNGILYTVEETSVGKVHAWRMDGENPGHLAEVETGGADPCHLMISGDGKYLYASNYSGGSLACFALDDEGIPTGRTDLARHEGRGPDFYRQEKAHVHFCLEREGLLYACDLGQDRIFVYRNEGGTLIQTGKLPLAPGYGPRHLAIHPAYPDLMYCVTELASRICVGRDRRKNGRWELMQDWPMLPENFWGANTAAAIHFTEDGKYLLSSNRGLDAIAVFAVNPDGTLEEPRVSHCVTQPRDFIILGDIVVVGSQQDSEIRSYRLNRETERLEETGFRAEVPRPVCFRRFG